MKHLTDEMDGKQGHSAIAFRAVVQTGSLTSSCTLEGDKHALQRGPINWQWLMSCSAPLPLSILEVAPPRITTADSAIDAFFTAVTVLVTPGPAVTHATPGTPVRR